MNRLGNKHTWVLAVNHQSRRETQACYREAYQTCAFRMPRASGQYVLQEEHGALVNLANHFNCHECSH